MDDFTENGVDIGLSCNEEEEVKAMDSCDDTGDGKSETSQKRYADESESEILEKRRRVEDYNRRFKIITPTSETMVGKNGCIWQTKPISQEDSRKHAPNISGPTGEAFQMVAPVDCFKLFFDDDLRNEILNHTNNNINRKSKRSDDDPSYMTLEELDAFLGILILSAALRDNHLPSKYLFDTSYCGDRYRASMSSSRFEYILCHLRFDNKELRNTEDPFAEMSKVWKMFTEQCKRYYKPGENVTIGEQVLPCRGKCDLPTHHRGSSKRGIKVVLMCDSNTKYLVDGQPLCQNSVLEPGEVDTLANELTDCISGSHRTVTLSNLTPTLSFAERMSKKRLYVVCKLDTTVNLELPDEFSNVKWLNRAVGSSLFLYRDKVSVLSYKFSKTANLQFMSSQHLFPEFDEDFNKPDLLVTYETTKKSVSLFDHMCKSMDCSRSRVRYWSLRFFYSMINMACINAYIIYVSNFYRTEAGDTAFSRQEFLMELNKQLSEDFQKNRLDAPHIQDITKGTICKVLGKPVVPEVSEDQRGLRKACYLCPYKIRRMTSIYCSSCVKPLCGSHQVRFCPHCVQMA